MHVHLNQMNPYIQLDNVHAAESAEARRAAAATRKKLREAASMLDGESDLGEASVVRLEFSEESHEQAKRQNQQNPGDREKQGEPADSQNVIKHVSGWA